MDPDISSDHRVALLGCGKMGSALLTGWIASGMSPKSILIIEPSDSNAQKARDLAVPVVKELHNFIDVKALVIAIKPQILRHTVQEIIPLIPEEALLISIAAGIPLNRITPEGSPHHIVRVMPNLAASIGEGASLLCADNLVTDEQKRIVEKLVGAIGPFWWLDDEDMIDRATAISGSGPAYLFHFAECLERSARNLGISTELARALTLQTIKGAALLASQPSSPTCTELRKQVTSPNGTTEAALEQLMTTLPDLIDETTQAAYRRAIELCKS